MTELKRNKPNARDRQGAARIFRMLAAISRQEGNLKEATTFAEVAHALETDTYHPVFWTKQQPEPEPR